MINMLLRAAADVLVPLAGRAVLFIAEDGVPAYMDSAGVVHTLQGGQGEQGDQGPDGLSAYQVWLAAGNVGTEADYLASLKGAQGDIGPQGPVGAGVPAGGATDSILAKSTAVDYVTKWIVKATTALAQAGTNNDSWMTPALTASEILAITGFGLSPTTAPIVDANTLGGSRVSRTNGATLNVPAGMAADGALLTIQTATDQAVQVWSTVREVGVSNRPALFVRGYYGATQAWGAWRRMADDSNVVHATGDETVAGAKTYTNTQTQNGAMQFGGNVQLRWGATGTAGLIRGTGTSLIIAAGDSDAVPGTLFLRPAGNANTAVQVSFAPTGLTFTMTDAAKAASRSSLGAVGLVGAETIAGAKLFTDPSRWNLGTQGSVQYSTPGNFPGILFRYGDPNTGDETSYRSEIRGRQGRMDFFVNNAASSAAGTAGIYFTTGSMGPAVTNTMSCGSAGQMWSEVFATNPAINPSDARLKTEPRAMMPEEVAAFLQIARLPNVWQWLQRVHEEGEGAEARLHAGPTVQAAIAIMQAHGLNPFDYACFCYDSWEAQPEEWKTWESSPAEVLEWPAQEAIYGTVPAELDEDGNILTEEHEVLLQEAQDGGRVVIKEAVEAGRELIQPAVEAGDRYGFRREELLAMIATAQAFRIDAIEARLSLVESRLA